MSDEGPEAIIVRCTRCAAGAYEVPIDALREKCSRCGEDVWLDAALPDDIAKHYPGHTYLLVCMDCDTGADAGPVVTPTSQIERMLAAGLTPKQVAHTIAVGAATGGVGSMEDTQIEIMLRPEGERAKAYLKALTEAKVMIAGILRRN
jgi:hypothetical protein